jgi:hypothetical protein
VGEVTNATGLPTAARRSTQRFGDLTFGISFVIYYQNVESYNAGILTTLSNHIGDVALLIVIA